MFRRMMLGSLLVCAGLLLGIVSAGLYLYAQQRELALLPVHERDGADAQACRVAEIAIAGHRAPATTTFAGDCLVPVVSYLGARPGFVVVTRTLKELQPTAGEAPRTFSVLLDGRQTDRWRIVDVRPGRSVPEPELSTLPPVPLQARQQATTREAVIR